MVGTIGRIQCDECFVTEVTFKGRTRVMGDELCPRAKDDNNQHCRMPVGLLETNCAAMIESSIEAADAVNMTFHNTEALGDNESFGIVVQRETKGKDTL